MYVCMYVCALGHSITITITSGSHAHPMLQGYPFGGVTQTVLYSVIAACDWFRLWLGYTGNLYERVRGGRIACAASWYICCCLVSSWLMMMMMTAFHTH